jgi:glycosyltransferase involved in cell wall biosynthesis
MLDNRYEDRPRNTSVELIKSWYLKLFNGYVYGGTPHRRYLVRLGVRCDRAVSGYDCVDNDTIASLASKLRKDRGQFNRTEAYVLCLGRLVEKKNWGRLLIAYRQYVDQRAPRSQPWKLVIAGEGPMRDAIERDIGHLGLSDLVRMTGQVDRFSEVVALHALAKVLVLASHHNEQWGLVVNEAMAASRPVLVSRECGCAEDLVCDGRNGFAFDPHSPSDLAEKLLWMHDHEGRLDEMGRAGYERIAEFSPERFAENIKTLFESRRELTQVRGRKRAQQDSTTTL